jgi:oligopeptide/dipeptide ABC transporter ATP-binding protein
MGALLDVRNLTTVLETKPLPTTVVDDVSFSVELGRTVGVVGESGCGKSMTALSLMRILPEPPARIIAGEVWLDGRDLLELSERQMQRVRGSEIAMIFQDPATSLNPVLTIGDQLCEAILAHRDVTRRAARAEAIELLSLVRMPDPARRLEEYAHRLSGGMRQRVMIAMALAGRPKLLVADEPTTALDVTIQSQILDLLKDLQRKLGMGILLITHDLGVVAEMADRVLVMYAGRVVEDADVFDVFRRPQHPYTRGLLAATPQFAAANDETDANHRLTEITGIVPLLNDLPPGCAFAPRCPIAEARCQTERPALSKNSGTQQVACLVAARGARG